MQISIIIMAVNPVLATIRRWRLNYQWHH